MAWFKLGTVIEWLAWLLIATVLLISAQLHAQNSDEGVLLAGALRIFRGDRLYLDFFEYVAPGAFYLISGVWRLIGDADYVSARIASCLSMALALAFLWATARTVADHRPSSVPLLLFALFVNFGPVINHNALFVLPASMALYFSASYLTWNRVSAIFLAGMAASASVLFLQHKGLALLLPLSLGLAFQAWRTNPSEFMRHVMALVAGVWIPLGILFLNWSPEGLFEVLIRFPAEHYLAVQSSNYFLFVGFLALTVLVFWISRQMLAPEVWVGLLTVQLVLLFTSLQGVDLYHLSVVSMPLVIVLSTLMGDGVPWYGKLLGIGRVCFALSLAGSLFFVGAFRFWNLTVETLTYQTASENLMREIRKVCGSEAILFAGPFLPGIYFETKIPNISRYSVLLEGLNTFDQFNEVAAALSRERFACGVTSMESAAKFGHRGNNPVDELLSREFKVVQELYGFKIYSRR